MWGNFHNLSHPRSGKPITTEQAIRRLKILGYTKEDEPIRLVIERMVNRESDCTERIFI